MHAVMFTFEAIDARGNRRMLSSADVVEIHFATMTVRVRPTGETYTVKVSGQGVIQNFLTTIPAGFHPLRGIAVRAEGLLWLESSLTSLKIGYDGWQTVHPMLNPQGREIADLEKAAGLTELSTHTSVKLAQASVWNGTHICIHDKWLKVLPTWRPAIRATLRAGWIRLNYDFAINPTQIRGLRDYRLLQLGARDAYPLALMPAPWRAWIGALPWGEIEPGRHVNLAAVRSITQDFDDNEVRLNLGHGVVVKAALDEAPRLNLLLKEYHGRAGAGGQVVFPAPGP